MRIKHLFRNYFMVLVLTFLLTGCGGNGSDDNTSDGLPHVDRTDHFVTQFGITWYFDKAYQTGQFANGDYWVVGPVTIVGIDPPSTDIDGRTMNGSMVNPDPLDGATQGYDSAAYDQYGPDFDPTLNVARPNNIDLSRSNPLVLPVNSSLVSTISIAAAGSRPQLQTAAILTVLSTAPPADSFRPSYTGSDKAILFNKGDIDHNVLLSLNAVANTPALNEVENNFEMPWIDHIPTWTGRYIHPVDNMPGYGRGITHQTGDAALSLMLNYSNAEKETLLTRFLQVGIDLYGVAINEGEWPDLGGHMMGRKMPILFAAKVLHNNPNSNNLLSIIDASKYFIFQEDRQTFIVQDSDVGRPLYHDDGRPREEYILEDVGLPEWGAQHTRNPDRDGRNWDAPYRTLVGHSMIGHILVAHMLDGINDWHWDPLFQYTDRLISIDGSLSDHEWDVQGSLFARYMWNAYRGNYPIMWP